MFVAGAPVVVTNPDDDVKGYLGMVGAITEVKRDQEYMVLFPGRKGPTLFFERELSTGIMENE